MSETTETAPADLETRKRRLRLRCWHRGTKEMDLLLGRYADAELAGLDEAGVSALEALIPENDWDLYYWVTGARPVPEEHAGIIERVAAFHGMR